MAKKQPTLYLIVGLPGSGKTSRAKELETAENALRFTPDEWILALYGHELDRSHRDAVRDPVEALQWQIAKHVLTLGCSVILDWGFWSRAERLSYREQAEYMGIKVKIIFLDMPLDVLWERISKRIESSKGTLHITRSELEHWAAVFEPPTNEELSE